MRDHLSERHYQLVGDAAPAMVWIADDQGRRHWTNRNLSRFLGKQFQDAPTDAWADLIHPEDLPRFRKKTATAEAVRQPYEQEYRLRRHDGEWRHIEDRAAPRIDEEGQFSGWIGICFDVTDRLEGEHQTLKEQEDLAHLSRVALIGEMASGMAHELNQPLAAIGNYAAGLRRMLDADQMEGGRLRQAVLGIESQAKRAADIVSRTRDFVRHKSGQRERIDVNTLIQDATALARPAVKRTGARLETMTSEQIPRLFGDRIQLEQVLVNLLLNALDASADLPPAERVVRIVAAEKGREVHISVIDRGPGVPAEMRERIFDPYVSTKQEGMGMGLAITRSIVEAAGGHVEVDDAPTGGARLTVVLPTAD